jgi:DNA-binding LytR/AlgR family response regulator
MEYLVFYLIFPEDVFLILTTILPFKIVIGLLIFLIVIQFYGIVPSVEPAEPTEDETEMVPEIASPGFTQKSTKKILLDKITVKSGSNINIIMVSDLLYLQAEGDYVILYTASARYIKEDTMKHLEEQLPPHFIRIHRSCILNTNYISRIELYEKQNYKITLKPGQQLKASVTGYKLLKENLQL